MALATDSPPADPPPRLLRWTGRLSLARRILLVNLLPIALLAGSLFYLDAIRNRLLAERVAQAVSENRLIAAMLQASPKAMRTEQIDRLGQLAGMRLRLFDGHKLISDSWKNRKPSFALTNPDQEPWDKALAASLDDAIDALVSAPPVPRFKAFSGPDGPPATLYLTDDRTHIISARTSLGPETSETLVIDRNVRDVRRLVRAERARLGLIIGMSILSSILLSFFLARTIARPLGALAMAAERVRLGRAREIVIPRFDRQDEIGALANALAEMTENLRDRIDATEAFAADVAHELRNPLASLSSALEAMQSVDDPELKAQLMAIATEDVRRLDRLITDIAEASRLEPQLTRTRFDRIDIGRLIETLLKERDARGANRAVRIAFARPQRGSAAIMGDAGRVSRAIENLIDNAVSFSPPKGVVQISATRSGDTVRVIVEDEGPGIAASQREAIFERFHSDRPDMASFGKHSGLGLSIARTIVSAHEGKIEVRDRPQKQTGALFIMTFPAASSAR
jgi:two-component system sensor histidine kinase ChvG